MPFPLVDLEHEMMKYNMFKLSMLANDQYRRSIFSEVRILVAVKGVQ